MKRILSYMKKKKAEFILGPLFKMLEAIFELFVPIVVAHIVDRGIRANNFKYVIHMTIVLVVLAIIGFASSLIGQYFAAKQSSRLATDLRRDLYSHTQNLSVADKISLGDSTLITRLTSDINQVETATNFFIRQLLRSPVVLIGATIMAFTIDKKSTLIFLITIPALFFIVFIIMKITAPKYKECQMRLDEDTLILKEHLTGIRVIRAFNREKDENKRFNVANKLLYKAQKIAGHISSFMNPLTYITINVGIIALMWFGASFVNVGEISQGSVVALYNYMGQILVELLKLANLIILISKAFACSNRIEEVFEKKPSIVSGNMEVNRKEASEFKVSFKNVSLKYENASGDAIENINLNVKNKEIIGIIGGTGSGKSTLVNMIPRLLDATDGEVLINDINVKEYKLDSLRNAIGIVPQKSILFSGSIRENMCFGKKDASDEEIWEALFVAQAKEFVEAKDGGLDYMIQRGGSNLSGGQKQRLSIARALVKKPDILILDDSASALDFETDAKLKKAILNLKDSPTTFIVSQRIASIMHADKIIVLDNGKIIAMGKHDELKENCKLYKEIYSMQFKEER